MWNFSFTPANRPEILERALCVGTSHTTWITQRFLPAGLS